MSKVTGVILCGGRGSRLNEIGEKIPKTLLEVNGQPILRYTLDQFKNYSIEDIRVAVGHLGEKIKTYLEREEIPAKVIDDGVNASMLQRLNSTIPDEPGDTLVVYGDTFIDMDLEEFINFHKKEKKTLTLIAGENRSPWGVLELDGSKVSSFKEKPKFTYYIGGFLCDNAFKKEMLENQISQEDSLGLVDLIQELIARKDVACYVHKGFTTTFNTVIELKESDKELRKYMTMDQT